jgi:mycothiol synthase
MRSRILKDQTDIQDMRRLMEKLPRVSAIPDFEELIQLSSIRQVTRLWREDGVLHAFAFVDEFNNLWFETDQAAPSADLEHLILAWGVQVMKERNATAGESNTLDAACHSDDRNRIAILNKNGFVKQHTRSLRYARSLELPIIPIELPSGFSIRPVRGDEESQDLVALHRAAFGTENMTVEHRLAIMRAPQYCRELDLVVVATGGELAAFCICGIDPENSGLGFTDPVGVHPIYRNRGLAKVVITAGMQALKRRGVKKVELGTSSENSAMVRLALLLGFELVSEGLWFSKTVV